MSLKIKGPLINGVFIQISHASLFIYLYDIPKAFLLNRSPVLTMVLKAIDQANYGSEKQ